MENELSQIESSLKDSDLTSGLESLQLLLNKHKSSQTSLQIILNRLYTLGQFLIKQKSFRTIFPLFQVLSKLCLILQESSRLCDIKNSLSFCYRTSGQVHLALKECLEALEVAGEAKSLYLKLPALHLNACAIYREDVKDLNIAKTHAELAYFFAKENMLSGDEKDKKTVAVACYNYAVVLEELKDKAHALVWFKEGLKFCEEKWDDVHFEQVFRDKVNYLSLLDSSRKTVYGKKRTVSQRPSAVKRYQGRDLNHARPLTYKKEKLQNKFNLTPISNKNLPLHSVNLDRVSVLQELGNLDIGSKKRQIFTPVSNCKAKATSDTLKTTCRPRLSLLQSVIKLQRWYRRAFAREQSRLKLTYLVKTVKTFFGVNYFLCLTSRPEAQYLAEAWPLTRQIKKPDSATLTQSELMHQLDCPEPSSLSSRTFHLSHLISVSQGHIYLAKISQIFAASQEISGQVFDLVIIFHRRNLEIQASQGLKVLTCSVKLDPLHDVDNIKNKVPLIIENLSLVSGKLLFKLM